MDLRQKNSPTLPRLRTHFVATFAIVVCFALILHWMGRVPWCTCGFGIWTPEALSEETSQHLADPYTFTHVLHGIIFYWLAGLFPAASPIKRRYYVAILLEVGWEILENSPPVIERYRDATAALGYVGDSILNALGDVIACILGFWLAARLATKYVLALVLLEEVVLLIAIRDNLTLNIVMLLFPLEPVKQWQLGS
jgi:hypothetical protein